MNRFLDYVPPIYRATVIETGIYPSLIINEINGINAVVADIVGGNQ